jgi:hypothetical protein
MLKHRPITIEGYTTDELLSLAGEQVDKFILCRQPMVIKVGSAEILGQFKVNIDTLVIELAQIQGGGEGVLLSISSIAQQYAVKKGLDKIEWIVHAVDCAKPNLKLRRILELRGFKIENLADVGEAYHYIQVITKEPAEDWQ